MMALLQFLVCEHALSCFVGGANVALIQSRARPGRGKKTLMIHSYKDGKSHYTTYFVPPLSHHGLQSECSGC